jgi:putative colanic acid biosynthesis acetyltransferase WcaF
MPGVKVLMPWHLTLEDHVAIGRNVDLYNFSPITVRRMSVVSQDTTLCTGSHDFRQPDMPLTHAPIVIGRECWVAAQTFVCPGVEIADGVVVGARSLVTRSLTEPWSVYAGHPARRVGPRVMDGQDVRTR